jgi:hypothetical protein
MNTNNASEYVEWMADHNVSLLTWEVCNCPIADLGGIMTEHTRHIVISCKTCRPAFTTYSYGHKTKEFTMYGKKYILFTLEK